MDKVEEVLDILLLVAGRQVEWCIERMDKLPQSQEYLTRDSFKEFALQVCQLFELKPTEGWLLTDEEMKIYWRTGKVNREGIAQGWFDIDALIQAQDVLTKRKMGKLVDKEFRRHPDLPLYYNRWQVLKKEIGL